MPSSVQVQITTPMHRPARLLQEVSKPLSQVAAEKGLAA